MKKQSKYTNFISKLEQQLLTENQEAVFIQGLNEEHTIGGKTNKWCSNIDSSCDGKKVKNKACSNRNTSGCKDSKNSKGCSNLRV